MNGLDRRRTNLMASIMVMSLSMQGAMVVAIPPDSELPQGVQRWLETDYANLAPSNPALFNQSINLSQSSAATLTGGDACIDTAATLLSVPGSVALLGDNTPATAPDACLGGIGPLWWESFEIEKCADVTLDFCGSSIFLSPAYALLVTHCASDGLSCSGFLGADSSNRSTCGDSNLTMFFEALPAGRYYYPIISNTVGAYQMTITTAGCSGACCNYATGGCTEGVFENNCVAPTEQFNGGLQCCEVECREPSAPEFDASGVQLLSHLTLEDFATFRGTPGNPRQGNEAWGYVSPAGREYAIMGFTTGTGIVDITIPASPVILAFIDAGGVDAIWRDMATFGDKLYVVTDGAGVTLQIIDLSQIDSGIVTFIKSTDLGVGFNSAHNVTINEDSGFMYLPLSNLNGGEGITVVDLADPVNPVVAGTWTDAASRCHDVQVVTYTSGVNAGLEIAFCFAEGAGLKIVNVTDKNNMVTLSTLTYPNVSYCHQGWLTEDKQHVIFGDELDEYFGAVSSTVTYVADVSNLSSPTLAATFIHESCNIDHNLMVRGDRVYQANYTTGLQILDATDPTNMSLVGFFDTRPEDNSQDFFGAWGVYTDYPSGVIIISDLERGLFVLEEFVETPDIPAVSQWGVLLLALMVLTVGTLVIVRRQAGLA